MRLIQPILILSLIIIVLIYFSRGRSRLLDRLLILFLTGSGILLIAMPEWSNQIAHFFGVENGKDLLSYFSVAGLGIVSLLLYTKLKEVEEKFTNLVRAVAIEHASTPSNLTEKKDDAIDEQ